MWHGSSTLMTPENATRSMAILFIICCTVQMREASNDAVPMSDVLIMSQEPWLGQLHCEHPGSAHDASMLLASQHSQGSEIQLERVALQSMLVGEHGPHRKPSMGGLCYISCHSSCTFWGFM